MIEKSVMILISQNVTNYNIKVPENAVFRINLAWINKIEEIIKLLKKYETQKIFLDLPINRTKPPNNKYSFDDLVNILKVFKNIKYLAISNVNNIEDIEKYLKLTPQNITIIPKIESCLGVENIESITNQLTFEEKIVMLDHDDLYSDILKNNMPKEKFSFYVNQLVDFCRENKIELLRTIGVIFANDEKNVSDYVR
tara:strand:- start:129 stop:719 length:591 start_codon:yes stop_codon:yes gene_type:complete